LKICLVCDLEDLNFLHCEILRTDEEVRDGGVICVYAFTPMPFNANATVSVRIAVIVGINASSKYRSPSGIANDCIILPVCSQCKFLRRDGARVLQREEKLRTLSLPFWQLLASTFHLTHPRLPLHRREAAENIPVHVRNQCQSIRVAVAVAVDFGDAETIAAASPQQFKTLHAELFKKQPNVLHNQRIERTMRQPITNHQSTRVRAIAQRGIVKKSRDCCRAQRFPSDMAKKWQIRKRQQNLL
jgi:hypothetical protein